jgi:hypothetical protein
MSLTKCDSWDSTQPSYGQYPILVRHLRMMVSVGTNVVVNVDERPDRERLLEFSGDGKLIATIVSYESDADIICVLYQLAEATSALPNNLPAPIMGGFGYGLKELVKTRYKVVVRREDIIDFAFIFSLQDVEEDAINYFGITNCYLLRFQVDNGLHEDVIDYIKFPCESDEYLLDDRSISANIWCGICRIQDAMWRVMNSESERQVPIVRVPVLIDTVTLNYLEYRSRGVVEKRSIKSRQIRSLTHKGAKRGTYRARNEAHLMRYETQSQLAVLRKIIGNSCTFGIRRRRPKLGREDQLEYNNTLNIIIGINDENNPQAALTTPKYIYHDSVDIVVDTRQSYMIVRYEGYNYNGSGVTNESTDLNNNEYVSDIMSGVCKVPKRNKPIRVGQIFGRGEDILLRVVTINAETAVLRYLEPEHIAGQEIYSKMIWNCYVSK